MEKQVLFKCLYGSELYGTDTLTSDTDYITVFLPNFKDVLLGHQLYTKVRTSSNNKVKNSVDDVDERFVPFQTFVKEFFEGQTYALELVMALCMYKQNPEKIKDKVLYVDSMFVLFVEELVEKFLHSDVKAMVGYAWNQAKKYQLKGRRFNALKLFKLYLEKFDKNVKVSTFMKQAAIDKFFDGSNYFRFYEVEVNDRMLPAVQVMDKLVLSTVPVAELVHIVNSFLEQYGYRSKKAVEQDVDWKSLYHALRVAFQTRDLLAKGYFDIPYSEDQRTLLLAIKSGQIQFELATELLRTVIDDIDELKISTMLQTKTTQLKNEFDDFVYDWLNKLYLKD